MSSKTITREQLYDQVWTQPMIKVAAEYGLPDVAVKKMCRKMNVPTPPRGYWARLAAGHRVKKPVLPKQHDVATARVDPARNAQRREQSQRVATLHNNMDPLEIPAELGINQLHPQARAVHAALKKAKPDHHGIVDTDTDNLPLVHVAVSNVDRVSRVLHVVFSELESRGLSLQPVRLHDRKRLGFQQGEDAMTLSIEEPIISIKRPPTPEELRRPSREWKLESYQPSGNFRVVLHECYGTWSNRSLLRNEGPRRPLGMLLAEIVDGIWDYFVRKETDRQRKKAEAEAEAKRQQLEAERSRRAAEERAAQVAIRKEEERQENHRQKLASLAAARVENALRAAEWWRLHRVMLDYVYILESVGHPDRFYVGLTEDLSARLKKHNAGAVPHTSQCRPERIKTAIASTDRERVPAFEAYLKSSSDRAFARKRL